MAASPHRRDGTGVWPGALRPSFAALLVMDNRTNRDWGERGERPPTPRCVFLMCLLLQSAEGQIMAEDVVPTHSGTSSRLMRLSRSHVFW